MRNLLLIDVTILLEVFNLGRLLFELSGYTKLEELIRFSVMHVTYSLISNTFTYPRIDLTEHKSFSNRQIFFFNWLKGGQNKFHSHALSLL